MALTFQITNAGLTAAQQAGTGGPKITLTSFQLGSGVNYTPAATQTQLVGSSVFSGSINNYYIQDPNTVVYILQVPLTAPQFSWGEVGIYTDTGVLFAVAARPTLRTSELGIATTIQVNLSLTQLPAVINFTVSNVQSANLSVLSSVDLLTAPVTSSANTYVCKSLSDAGNVVVATAINNNNWQFLGYQTTFGPYQVVAGATTTVVSSPAGVPIFNSLISTPPPLGAILIQFTSGALTGTVRRVTWPSVTSNSLTISGTALGAVPSPGDTYKLYLSDTYVMSSGIGGAGTGGGLTAVASVDILPTVTASASKGVITTNSVDDTGTAWMFEGELATNLWHPLANPMSTPLCIIDGMANAGYNSLNQLQIPAQYFTYTNTGQTSDSMIGLMSVFATQTPGLDVFHDIANSMVMSFRTGANAGLVRVITNEWNDVIANGPQFSSPWPNKINDGDTYVVSISPTATIKLLQNQISGVEGVINTLSGNLAQMPLGYVNIGSTDQGKVLLPPAPPNNTQLFAGVVPNPYDYTMDTFMYNPATGIWTPSGWTGMGVTGAISVSGTLSLSAISSPNLGGSATIGQRGINAGSALFVYKAASSPSLTYVYAHGDFLISNTTTTTVGLGTLVPQTGSTFIGLTMFLKATLTQ